MDVQKVTTSTPADTELKISAMPAPNWFEKALKAVQVVGFPVVVSGVLLYMMATTGNETVKQLKVANERLQQIDAKLTALIYARPAGGKK